MALGLYVSVPFCRTKCSYCNFASDVFSRAVHHNYVDRVCESIKSSPSVAEQIGCSIEEQVNSIFIGGGTPTLLETSELERIFVAILTNFDVQPDAEITVECAPGTLTRHVLETFNRCGVNRVSLGVQSFVDHEAASVGRLHKRETVLHDIVNLRAAGISNINLDLIAGLPHQTAESWRYSLSEVIAAGVPHVSVYMLEVDDDSRLGRELIAGGKKYHAHSVPDEDLIADFYDEACMRLNAAGIAQYEISNFSRNAYQSRHNLKYWTRQPYLGFGVDAHSMLRSKLSDNSSVRFSSPDSLEQYVAGAPLKISPISPQAALEEVFFLGLRLNGGIDLNSIDLNIIDLNTIDSNSIDLNSSDPSTADRRSPAFSATLEVIEECLKDGLLNKIDDRIWLTSRGRLLSNEVFQRFISAEKESTAQPV